MVANEIANTKRRSLFILPPMRFILTLFRFLFSQVLLREGSEPPQTDLPLAKASTGRYSLEREQLTITFHNFARCNIVQYLSFLSRM